MVKLRIHELASVLCSLLTNLFKLLRAVRHLVDWHVWIALQCFEQCLLLLAHVCEELCALGRLLLGRHLCSFIFKLFLALFVLEVDPELVEEGELVRRKLVDLSLSLCEANRC